VGLPTLRDIMAELEKPGRDPRPAFQVFRFADVHDMSDLHPGMTVPGIVTNVTRFGAFVDVGVHQDGLVHISNLADRYVSDPGEVVGPDSRYRSRCWRWISKAQAHQPLHAHLRIFEDAQGKMNRCLIETGGAMLVVSQFTLLGDCRKGRRPSFVAAAPPEKAEALYQRFTDQVRAMGIDVSTGRFRAMMQVSLINDGPVTLIVET
jgi:D-tyrosyl-tRNA(Tyr) deacylase